MTTKTVNLYQFAELSDEAKEKAREWFRRSNDDDDDWEYMKDDFTEMMAVFGFDVHDTYYSGFWSQGDGASFTGSWYYKAGWRKAFLSAYPTESKYLGYMDAIAQAAKDNFYQVSASISHRGHYQHSGCMSIDVRTDKEKFAGDTEDTIMDNFRYIADTFYNALESAYDWRNADEQVDESIIMNAYTFTIEGKREN
jgi:hypothetical protein